MTRRSRSARGAKQARASDVVAQRDQLGATEGELDEFFESAVMPVHFIAADGTILRANRAELEMLGYSRDEYVGTNIANYYVDPAVGTDILGRLTRGETIREVHTKLRCKD